MSCRAINSMGVKDIILFLVAFALVFTGGMRGRSLSKEEDIELDRQLKLLNKPAMKTIQEEDGGIIDCVDINKQPSLDHPLLLNHTVQRRPSSLPQGTPHEISSTSSSNARVRGVRCPLGTVPIRRTRKEDLIRIKSFSEDNLRHGNHPNDASPQNIYHNAVLRTNGEYHGTRARLNVWGLNLTQNQFSSSLIWIQNGPDAIQAGWIVNPTLFGDSRTRLYTSWAANNNHGCINLLCQGFVHVNHKIVLGSPIEPVSVYDGPNYEIALKIFKDPSQGNWWLMAGKQDDETGIGYWPKSLFTSLAESGSVFTWGGVVFGPANEPSPPMGSGHFPDELYKKACYTMDIQLVDKTNRLVDPKEANIIEDKHECYNAAEWLARGLGRYLYFGGPGNCKS